MHPCSLPSLLFVQIFGKAVDALSHLFFAGLQEEFQLSSEALVRAMGMAERMPLPEIKKERDHNSGKVSQEKAQLKADEGLMRRAREVNQFDLRLYDLGEPLTLSSASQCFLFTPFLIFSRLLLRCSCPEVLLRCASLPGSVRQGQGARQSPVHHFQ